MKTRSIGYHNKSLVFSADIQVGIPESGFLLQIGRSGDPDFYPAISFSGSEGLYSIKKASLFAGIDRTSFLIFLVIIFMATRVCLETC